MRKSRATWTHTAIVLLAATGACAPEPQAGPPQTPQGAPPSAAAPARAESPPDPRVDDLVSRYVTARGGLDRIHAIRSIRMTGKARYGDGDFTLETVHGVEIERPGKVRTENTYQGLTGVHAYDGKEAWSTDPFGGRRDPFRKSADESKDLAHEADLEGPLVDWRQKGHRVEYLGTEDIEGTLAHKLRVTRPDGDIDYRYLDPDSFLEIRVLEESHVRGVEVTTEIDLGDYGKVQGVWFPMSIDSGKKGAPKTAHFLIDHVEANFTVDEADFSFPAPGAKVVRAVVANEAAVPDFTSPPPPPNATPVLDRGVLSGLAPRNIGAAAMSGRVSAVAARSEGGKTLLYVGAASGGVWKSLDGGTTFKPVFDKEPVQSIGAVTLDPSRPETVWVGTGESWTRNSTSIGNGVYKSTDAGATWTNVGLPESERITRIVVHPKNSDVVYVCVPGKLWSDSADRGLYKTTDGGKTWALVLPGGNLSTGCSSLSLDPKDPEVLFAGMWDFRRKGWTYRSGGDGPDAASASGLFRSADGGKTWTELTSASRKGLPAHPWGRVEVAVAPSDASTVYAFVESKDSALYASSDGGATWERRDSSQMMVWRPFYFARLVVDPTTPTRLFKPDLNLIVSEDGGKSFSGTGGGCHGDWHDIWIDPGNPKHVIGGNDGGLCISYDGGSQWWMSMNLPISQFYHVSLDGHDPYRVYGGLQDNSTWVGDSAYPGGVSNSRWENVYGGDGFWAMVDPTDANAIYAEYQGGHIGRVDRPTLATRDIQPQAGFKEKLRFNWNTPIVASPTQKGTLYIGAQFLFRSRDRGDTWERVSPDLTTNDKEKQKQEESGGVTVDNSSAEMHTTIYAISESPKDPRILWVGTDDGNLQLSKDAGKTWTNLAASVPGLPKFSWVSWVEASRYDAATAYAAFDRHTFGDMTPWVYVTHDTGRTWTRLATPEQGVRGYAHVVKEDAQKKELLFVGTELGLWTSLDAGAHWAELRGGEFPQGIAVRDLEVHPREGDLVIATHGRGIWIIDDLTPLRQLSLEALARPAAFLPARPTQQRMPAGGGWSEGDATYSGQNPASGATITYYQRARHLYGPLKLEILDPKGQVIDTLPAAKRRGINRVTWTMQMKPPRVPRAAQAAFGSTQGPHVLPGTYKARLTKGADVVETALDIRLDRRAPFTIADRKAQLDAALRARDLFGKMTDLTDRIDAARAATVARGKELPQGDALGARLAAAATKLDETKKKIVATKEGGAITGEERIREHLDQLYGALMQWEGRPPRYQVERLDTLARELDEVKGEFDAFAKTVLGPLAVELKAKGLGAIPVALGEGAGEVRLDGKALAAMRCLSDAAECSEPSRRAAEENER